MSEKPYYEQEYVPEASSVPDPSFGQIFKGLFTAPFKWNARSTRKAFWVAFAIQCVASAILSILIAVSLIPSAHYSYTNGSVNWSITGGSLAIITIILEIVWVLLLFWIQLGMLGYAVRRLHDSDHSGWWLWLDCIPFGWIFILYFLILPSVEKPVRWGSYLFIDED